ncbi:protein nirF [Achromobacter denitrificans]|uniref:cytochrome D1 domain-containing protein n=1 Tax=Achromobacter denitrificans TaxID=32002 RepID=UPI000787401C|nr:cytochrome D1 domain-containing protein [Achromobacter denitrificans]MDX3880651.1 cytochrome D1 domain-containing protein [Achromobacter sp.]MBV2160744.1 protein nirF [Achromobacter denitrificans]MDF3846510.1 cytochrome D1 domain-containing protein [Achromobacter denitrificans]MDF3943058.1 cytochrome D1 domain-containing protein [Achromobacter denitrificans]OLU09991.1 protein nirF [Achromobacter denitrificans]
MNLRFLAILAAIVVLSGCAPASAPRGTNDLGLVIERADGSVSLVETSGPSVLQRIEGLGDLSHAHIAYSRDGRYGYVFGRDGGLTKVDLLRARVDRRVVQSGNAIGGSISQDGRLIVVQNYEPGGIKVFDAETLRQISEVPAEYAPGRRSKVVGLADLPGQKFAYALFDAGEIWITDLTDPARPSTRRFAAGRQPYDALVTPDGRYYIAGLFGEDALAMIDLWHPEAGVRKILQGYGRGEQPLPVYKMPHLRGWGMAGRRLYLPAIGRHEVLVVDTDSWREVGRVATLGQPVFVMAQPDGRRVWVNFAVPDNGQVQVIDTETLGVIRTLAPGRGILHMEFTPRGESVWLSARDDDRVLVYDTRTLERGSSFDIPKPSGIFFTHRSTRIGF